MVKWTNKYLVIKSHKGIIGSTKNKGTTPTSNNVNEPHKYNAETETLGTK